MNRASFKCALLCSSLLLAGCDAWRERPALVLDTSGVTPAADCADLAVVLDKAVTDAGLVRPELLAEQTDRLNGQLRLLAASGPTASPELFGSTDHQLAYWYNARTAWAIKLLAEEEFDERLDVKAMSSRQFSLDGRLMSLDAIDEAIERLAGWQGVVAAPGVSSDRAALPAEPFSSPDVRQRVGRRLSDFVDDSDRVVIDVARRQIRIRPILWRYRSRLIAEHSRTYHVQGANFATALLGHVTGSARRRLLDATGYRAVPATERPRAAVFKL